VRLKGLDILLTYKCTGRCAHCCYRAGPDRRQTMTATEVAGYLDAVAHQPLEGILLFGGEPFLCYNLLRDCIPLAASLAQQIYVFTNGYWATDPATARRLLAGLQEAGLDYILFSVDAFHQAHAPLERVAIGIEAARALGYATIEIDNRCLGAPEADNFFNRRTQMAMARLAELCDLSSINVHQGPARIVGRAADKLASFLPTQTAPPAHCPLPDYLGGELRAPTGVEIHPGGWVNLCAGLALGNAQQRPLARILADYDPDAHPIVGVLAREGPAGLLRLAQERGHSLPGGYVDGCHLCYQARSLLQSHYPDHLAPAYTYVEGAYPPVLRLEESIVYGPVHSRRLGRSLGINLLPSDRKLCSFDCIYCHYGRTDATTLSAEGRRLPDVEQVLDVVEEGLRTHAEVEHLTFSGNGEPTLHPQFPTIVAGVRRLRDALKPEAKLALLSNSTTVHLPRIRETLALFDAPIMKLDAGDRETLLAINRPAQGVKLERIVEGLKGIPNLVVQSTLVEGAASNVQGESLEAWLAALAAIGPARVQIYSTDRPVPQADVERAPPRTLRRIAQEVEERTGIPVAAYWM